MKLEIRNAREQDSALILRFILALADLEGMRGQVTASEESVRISLFERHDAEVLLGYADAEPVAFALYYPVYSTFTGTANLFLEDLFVDEAYRSRGVGCELLRHLAQIVLERGGKRLDWYVLHSNVKGAEFYRRLGAKPLTDRTTFRINEEQLRALSQGGTEFVKSKSRTADGANT